jgi:hypothetical protein
MKKHEVQSWTNQMLKDEFQKTINWQKNPQPNIAIKKIRIKAESKNKLEDKIEKKIHFNKKN